MDGVQSEPQTVSTGLARLADMAHAKGDARRLRAALDACGLALLAPKFAEHGVDDSCLPALEDEDLEAMGIEPASRTTILAVVKAPPETSSERVAALEARNRELADALDAAAAGAAANEARFTEALQIAGRLRDRVLALEERNDWLEAGKEDYKKRLQSEAAEADGPRGHPPAGRVQLARPNGPSGCWPARGQL